MGVLAFSFTTSSLSTLITNIDSRNAKLKARLAQLNALNSKYHLSLRLYHKLEKVLKFDHSKNEQFETSFLNEIPQRLKVELSFCMYRKYIEKLPFLQEKNGHFIAFVCPMLVFQFVPDKEIIYKEGDPVNEVYFLLSGKVGMVLNVEAKQHVFMYIEEGHYFGEIDLLSQAVITGTSSKSSTLDKKRKFTTVAIDNCELLLWSKKNIYLADSEFDDVIKSIFQTAKKRLRKALDAKRQAAEYYNELKSKAERSHFAPIVTRAHSDSNNIFQHRKQNLNDDEDNGTIVEENESEDNDQTFTKLNGEREEDSKADGSMLSPTKTPKPALKRRAESTPQVADKDEVESTKTPKRANLLLTQGKNSGKFSRTLKKKSSDNFLASLNEENVQNVHFMQIKSISCNFTPVSTSSHTLPLDIKSPYKPFKTL